MEMPFSRVGFLGGNGHCTARLAAARPYLIDVNLYEVAYPGFEGRPRAASFEEFLDAVSADLRASDPVLVYALGIGGLLALCLRARGEIAETPILMQGPILWGLERRWMPKLMRLRPAQTALLRVFSTASFQRRFVEKYFVRQPDPATVEAFFDGYARCTAAPDFFAWFNPSLLRSLERDLTARPEALEGISVWWGGQDRVVNLQELEWTKAALRGAARWPVRVFPEWGHYPMIDAPEEWAKALSDAVAETGAV
jgi:pimeloyl-ACP methyl ester carboxylesterase